MSVTKLSASQTLKAKVSISLEKQGFKPDLYYQEEYEAFVRTVFESVPEKKLYLVFEDYLQDSLYLIFAAAFGVMALAIYGVLSYFTIIPYLEWVLFAGLVTIGLSVLISALVFLCLSKTFEFHHLEIDRHTKDWKQLISQTRSPVTLEMRLDDVLSTVGEKSEIRAIVYNRFNRRLPGGHKHFLRKGHLAYKIVLCVDRGDNSSCYFPLYVGYFNIDEKK